MTERFKSLILFTEFQHWSPLKLLFGRVRELLHHGRRAGQEEMTEVQVVSGKTNLILHIETSVVVGESNSVVKPKCEQYTSLNKM